MRERLIGIGSCIGIARDRVDDQQQPNTDDSEDDVLALTRALDLRELVEDELLLALPIVPRHEVCPEPLPQPADDAAPAEPAPHPFAALAALKRTKPH